MGVSLAQNQTQRPRQKSKFASVIRNRKAILKIPETVDYQVVVEPKSRSHSMNSYHSLGLLGLDTFYGLDLHATTQSLEFHQLELQRSYMCWRFDAEVTVKTEEEELFF